MLQRISLCTADGSELFSGVSLLRSEPPPPPALADDVDEDEESSVRSAIATAAAAELLAQKSRPGNDNARAESQSGLRAAVREDA